ncbi:MAG: 2-oxo acid dehydrogenase subunit E2 [Oscillibacter sp.]|nr:2-oxo acid dehydrogenase subunit E2 [Oscillibacter sp.]
MASIVIMPKQGLMMVEGTLTKWLKREGEPVAAGEPLFEMETDKLTITMDAEASGTLLKIIHPEGDVVPITRPIAILGEPGEDISGLMETASPPEAVPAPAAGPAPAVPAGAPGRRVSASPRARLRAEENGVDLTAVPGSGPGGLVIERDVKAHLTSRPAVTPLAANLAKTRGVHLSDVAGSGPRGKITAADLPGETPAAPASRSTRAVPMSGMRRAIARNMLASKDANAQACHRMNVDMTAVIDLRRQYGDLGVRVSYNDVLIRVCAKALTDFPIVNASVEGDRILYHDYVNVGNAVSVPGGLIVPVIRDADLIGLTGIAARSAELIEKAREGRLTEAEYHGGTFTVSSLGMFDLDDFVAIINPPESAILAVGKIAKAPVVITNPQGEDELAIRPMCTLCLSYDHRIIDGAEAARFLQRVKHYLQHPVLLI